MSRVSVRLLVPAMVVLPVAGVATALGWISAGAARSSVGDLASRVVDQIGRRVAQRAGAHLGVADAASASTLVLIDAGVLDPDEPRAWSWALWRQMGVFEGLSGIAFGRPDGRTVWVARYPGDEHPEFAVKDAASAGAVEQYELLEGGGLGALARRVEGYEVTERPWYRAGSAGVTGGFPGSRTDAAWSAVYSWRRADGSGDTLGISYARPVYGAGGAFVGVLDAEVELVGLSAFLSGLRIGETGLAAIVEHDGRLVAASRAQGLVGDDGERRFVWASEEAATRAVGAAARARLAAGGGGLERVVVGGAEGARAWWVSIDALRSGGAGAGPDWLVVVAVPESDLLGGVLATRRRAVRGGLFATGVAVLVGVGGAVWLARPVVRLRRHVRAVGEGDLETEVRVGSALEFAELGREINAMQAGLRDRMRLRRSLELAMEVQQALLPREAPRVEGVDVAGQSWYCDETGGDYFDYVRVTEIAPAGLAVVLGDVMGHGVAAALLMAAARGVIRSRAGEVGSLGELLDFTNARMVEDSGGFRFMTMLLVMVDPGRRALRWASAGHGPPMVYDPGRGWLELELGPGGVPLGIDEGARYEEHEAAGLGSGTVVLLSTDGLWEARNAAGEEYGLGRVRAVVEARAGESSGAIAAALKGGLDGHCGGERPGDDVTFVVVKIA